MDTMLLIIIVVSILGPLIGSFIGVIKKPTDKFMYNMLAFAGGMMISISFLNLIPDSIALSNYWVAISGVALGALMMFSVGKILPHLHPEFRQLDSSKEHATKRTALYLIIGLAIHNFPEGMAIAVGTMSGAQAGLVIALAIAIHKIPEGICTAAPYFQATNKRLQSFVISSLTAIPVLLGFFIAEILFQNISETVIGFITGATAGFMIYISADEIIPTSSYKNSHHNTIFSLMLGVVMVILLGGII
jgi:ZIP family zinc transporter